MRAIDQIVLEEDSAFGRYAVRPEGGKRILRDLSTVNLFVGANNSGKSRFMRELARIKKLRFVPRGPTEQLQKLREKFCEALDAIYKKHHIVEMRRPFPTLGEIQQFDTANEGEPFGNVLLNLVETTSNVRDSSQLNFTHRGHSDRNRVLNDVVPLAQEILQEVREASSQFLPQYDFARIYIPTLRGLRRFQDLSDHYGQRTIEDYFPSDKNVAVFTGLTLYEDIKRLLLGTLEDREIVADFQRFLGKAFFNDQSVALIPRHDSTALHVKIGLETEYPIHNLGDGIQSIITLTFPLFRARGQRLLAFFEEPELFLHPGLQRLFLNVLLTTEGFENFQYFAATHSNHFLDLTLDLDEISVFTFRKELEDSEKKERDARFVIENVSNEDERPLQLLGVKNSSIFFSNCTIWIEGITDRRYLSKFISLYEDFLDREATRNQSQPLPRYKQDLHYSFVEYGGSNITHWSFLEEESNPIVVERLCAKLLLITDKDSAEDKSKTERHRRLTEKLVDRYVCLKRREIENVLTPDVILRVVRQFEGADADLANVNYDSYAQEPLGRFIEKRVLKSARKRKGSYAAESGTVSNKVDFCDRVLGELTIFEELSADAQELTKLMYEFIKNQNK